MGDWRDRGVRPWVITGSWEFAEPAESGEGVVESGAVTVVRREFGCEPNWKNGRHEAFSLVREGEFVEDKEDRVDVYYGDASVIDEGRDGLWLRKARRMGRRLVKPTPERGRFRELGCTR